MSISASQLAQANPSVLSAAGNNAALTALLLSQSSTTPINTALSFPSADAVGLYYGYQSTEYQFALDYFGGINNALALPASMLVMQYPATAQGAWLQSGSLKGMTLAQLQALSGTLTITVDGTANTSATINLSSATSFSNAASVILAGFTSPTFTCAWNSQLNAFVFTSNVTGKTQTITYATGTLAAPLLLTSAGGAVLSQGANAATPTTFMPTVLATTTQWATFTTAWQPVLADMVAFAQWNGAQNEEYTYVQYDTDPNLYSSSNFGLSAAGEIYAAGYEGTVPVYGDITTASIVCAWAACLNYSQRNGRTDLAGVSSPSVQPSVTDSTIAAQLVANKVNFYGDYSNKGQQFQAFEPGAVTGRFLWADSYVNQIKLNDDLQADQLNLLTTVRSIPYNAAGNALIESAYADTIQAHLNFGTIRTGVKLSASQIQQLYNNIGADVSQQIQTQGYYLHIGPNTAAMRVARTSPPITLYYTDGGDVQSLTINSVEIQ